MRPVTSTAAALGLLACTAMALSNQQVIFQPELHDLDASHESDVRAVDHAFHLDARQKHDDQLKKRMPEQPAPVESRMLWGLVQWRQGQQHVMTSEHQESNAKADLQSIRPLNREEPKVSYPKTEWMRDMGHLDEAPLTLHTHFGRIPSRVKAEANENHGHELTARSLTPLDREGPKEKFPKTEWLIDMDASTRPDRVGHPEGSARRIGSKPTPRPGQASAQDEGKEPVSTTSVKGKDPISTVPTDRKAEVTRSPRPLATPLILVAAGDVKKWLFPSALDVPLKSKHKGPTQEKLKKRNRQLEARMLGWGIHGLFKWHGDKPSSSQHKKSKPKVEAQSALKPLGREGPIAKDSKTKWLVDMADRNEVDVEVKGKNVAKPEGPDGRQVRHRQLEIRTVPPDGHQISVGDKPASYPKTEAPLQPVRYSAGEKGKAIVIEEPKHKDKTRGRTNKPRPASDAMNEPLLVAQPESKAKSARLGKADITPLLTPIGNMLFYHSGLIPLPEATGKGGAYKNGAKVTVKSNSFPHLQAYTGGASHASDFWQHLFSGEHAGSLGYQQPAHDMLAHSKETVRMVPSGTPLPKAKPLVIDEDAARRKAQLSIHARAQGTERIEKRSHRLEARAKGWSRKHPHSGSDSESETAPLLPLQREGPAPAPVPKVLEQKPVKDELDVQMMEFNEARIRPVRDGMRASMRKNTRGKTRAPLNKADITPIFTTHGRLVWHYSGLLKPTRGGFKDTGFGVARGRIPLNPYRQFRQGRGERSQVDGNYGFEPRPYRGRRTANQPDELPGPRTSDAKGKGVMSSPAETSSSAETPSPPEIRPTSPPTEFKKPKDIALNTADITPISTTAGRMIWHHSGLPEPTKGRERWTANQPGQLPKQVASDGKGKDFMYAHVLTSSSSEDSPPRTSRPKGSGRTKGIVINEEEARTRAELSGGAAAFGNKPTIPPDAKGKGKYMERRPYPLEVELSGGLAGFGIKPNVPPGIKGKGKATDKSHYRPLDYHPDNNHPLVKRMMGEGPPGSPRPVGNQHKAENSPPARSQASESNQDLRSSLPPIRVPRPFAREGSKSSPKSEIEMEMTDFNPSPSPEAPKPPTPEPYGATRDRPTRRYRAAQKEKWKAGDPAYEVEDSASPTSEGPVIRRVQSPVMDAPSKGKGAKKINEVSSVLKGLLRSYSPFGGFLHRQAGFDKETASPKLGRKVSWNKNSLMASDGVKINEPLVLYDRTKPVSGPGAQRGMPAANPALKRKTKWGILMDELKGSNRAESPRGAASSEDSPTGPPSSPRPLGETRLNSVVESMRAQAQARKGVEPGAGASGKGPVIKDQGSPKVKRSCRLEARMIGGHLGGCWSHETRPVAFPINKSKSLPPPEPLEHPPGDLEKPVSRRPLKPEILRGLGKKLFGAPTVQPPAQPAQNLLHRVNSSPALSRTRSQVKNKNAEDVGLELTDFNKLPVPPRRAADQGESVAVHETDKKGKGKRNGDGIGEEPKERKTILSYSGPVDGKRRGKITKMEDF